MMLRRITGIVSVVMVLAAATVGQDNGTMVSVVPTRARGVVINPGKGWVLYGEASRHDQRLLAVSNLGR